jgi:hypothetical protein
MLRLLASLRPNRGVLCETLVALGRALESASLRGFVELAAAATEALVGGGHASDAHHGPRTRRAASTASHESAGSLGSSGNAANSSALARLTSLYGSSASSPDEKLFQVMRTLRAVVPQVTLSCQIITLFGFN